MERKEVGNDNRCITCGEVIPEGRQVCPTCESEYWRDWYDRYVKEHTCLSYSEMLVGKLQAELKKTKQDASKAVLQAFAKLKQQLYGVVIIRAVNDETKEDMDSDEVFGVIEKLEKEYRKGEQL